MAASVATALPLARASSPSPLRLRILSSLVMAPVALAAVWFGGPWLPTLVLFAVAVMGWEWARLCAGRASGITGMLIMLTGVAAVAAAAAGGPALLTALCGAGAVLASAMLTRHADPFWAAGGTLWVSVCALSFVWLAALPEVGRATVLWLLAVVWATDIGAYAAGRGIGGPRLAARLSPKKTWAGLAGGVVSAGIVGLAAAPLAAASPALLGAASMGLALAAQAGDLAESFAKRHFGVKDSSHLIPGHGGLLDRLDGLLAGAVVTAFAVWLAGSSPLAWR